MTSNKLSLIFSRPYIKWLLLCFLLMVVAFLLWPGLVSQEIDLFIPIEANGVPPGLTITGHPLPGIDIHVRGPKSTLDNLSNLKTRYLLDLSGTEQGVNKIFIDKNQIALPKGTLITRVQPEFITLRVEKEIKKELPVVVAFADKPATGYLLAGAVINPLTVILSGPENILEPMEKIMTKPVNLKGLSESFKKEMALDLAEGVDVIGPSKIIQAEIFIVEKIVVKNYNDIPVIGTGTSYSYKIKPPMIRIAVRGPLNVLEKLYQENGIKVYIELKDLKPGIYTRHAVITLPVKTTLISAKPELFTVKINKP